jgi:hypothetical protein
MPPEPPQRSPGREACAAPPSRRRKTPIPGPGSTRQPGQGEKCPARRWTSRKTGDEPGAPAVSVPPPPGAKAAPRAPRRTPAPRGSRTRRDGDPARQAVGARREVGPSPLWLHHPSGTAGETNTSSTEQTPAPQAFAAPRHPPPSGSRCRVTVRAKAGKCIAFDRQAGSSPPPSPPLPRFRGTPTNRKSPPRRLSKTPPPTGPGGEDGPNPGVPRGRPPQHGRHEDGFQVPGGPPGRRPDRPRAACPPPPPGRPGRRPPRRAGRSPRSGGLGWAQPRLAAPFSSFANTAQNTTGRAASHCPTQKPVKV